MVNLGRELDFRGAERVITWEIDFEEEDATLIWRVGLSQCKEKFNGTGQCVYDETTYWSYYSSGPIVQVAGIVWTGAAGSRRVTVEIKQFL